MAREWKRDIGQLAYIADDGNWLEYGRFGRDTYGLHTVFDGKEHVIHMFGNSSCHVPDGYDLIAEADRLLDRIASGWRAVNWQ